MPDPPPRADDPAPRHKPSRSPARRRLDRRTVGICVCLALLAALAAGLVANVFVGDHSTGRAADRPALGTLRKVDPAAPVTVPTDPVERLTTGTFSLADFKGRPVVLNFFSSTCEPCVREMPDLERLHQQLGASVAFVGIDVQDTKADGRTLVRRTGVTYEIGYDAQANLLRAVEGKVLPTTALVGADGRVVTVHSTQITADELRQLLADHHLVPPA